MRLMTSSRSSVLVGASALSAMLSSFDLRLLAGSRPACRTPHSSPPQHPRACRQCPLAAERASSCRRSPQTDSNDRLQLAVSAHSIIAPGDDISFLVSEALRATDTLVLHYVSLPC